MHDYVEKEPLRSGVTVLGLGAIGLVVARALAEGQVRGLHLHSVAASSVDSARRKTASFPHPPEVVDIQATGSFGGIVVECLPPGCFPKVALPVLRSGRTLLPLSVGALLAHEEVLSAAEDAAGRILLPSGALGGLDAVRALCVLEPSRVELTTEKPVGAFEASSYLDGIGIDLGRLSERTCLYDGPALAGGQAFPKNVNVVAALALAGIGTAKTHLSLWADPAARHNRHTIRAIGRAGEFVGTLVNAPAPDNPKTSMLTPYSVIACLRNARARIRFA